MWRSAWVPALLVASLWANAFRLDPNRSAAGALANLAFCAPRGLVNRGTDIVVAWRDDPGAPVSLCYSHEAHLWLEDEQTDGQATIFFNRPRLQHTAWAPFVDIEHYGMHVLPSGPLAETEIASFRAAAFDFLAADPSSRLASVGSPPALRVGNFSVWRFNLVGTVQNLVAVASMAALLIWCVQRARHGRVPSLGSLRLAKGLCPRCEYPTHGLDSPICPECGQLLPR